MLDRVATLGLGPAAPERSEFHDAAAEDAARRDVLHGGALRLD